MSLRPECHKFWAFAFVDFMLCISFGGQLEFFPAVFTDRGFWALTDREHPEPPFLSHEPVKSGSQNGLYVAVT